MLWSDADIAALVAVQYSALYNWSEQSMCAALWSCRQYLVDTINGIMCIMGWGPTMLKLVQLTLYAFSQNCSAITANIQWQGEGSFCDTIVLKYVTLGNLPNFGNQFCQNISKYVPLFSNISEKIHTAYMPTPRQNKLG